MKVFILDDNRLAQLYGFLRPIAHLDLAAGRIVKLRETDNVALPERKVARVDGFTGVLVALVFANKVEPNVVFDEVEVRDVGHKDESDKHSGKARESRGHEVALGVAALKRQRCEERPSLAAHCLRDGDGARAGVRHGAARTSGGGWQK